MHIHTKWAPVQSYPHHSESLTAHHGRVMYVFTAFGMDQSQGNAAPRVQTVKLTHFKQSCFLITDLCLQPETHLLLDTFSKLDLKVSKGIRLYLTSRRKSSITWTFYKEQLDFKKVFTFSRFHTADAFKFLFVLLPLYQKMIWNCGKSQIHRYILVFSQSISKTNSLTTVCVH